MIVEPIRPSGKWSKGNLPHNALGPLNAWPGRIRMEKNQQHQSHKDREAQTLVDRIEKKEASQEADREVETNRTPDDFRKTV
jgi:hypothetical protein